jgi:hypothetical protein
LAVDDHTVIPDDMGIRDVLVDLFGQEVQPLDEFDGVLDGDLDVD